MMQSMWKYTFPFSYDLFRVYSHQGNHGAGLQAMEQFVAESKIQDQGGIWMAFEHRLSPLGGDYGVEMEWKRRLQVLWLGIWTQLRGLDDSKYNSHIMFQSYSHPKNICIFEQFKKRGISSPENEGNTFQTISGQILDSSL